MQPMKQKKLAEKAHKGTRVNISKQLPREAAGNANVEIMNCMSVIFKRLSARGIACAVIFILAQIAAAAQGVTLTGKVTDTDGAPVIGAGGVSMQKTSSGTTTDLDGRFRFSLPAETESVLFSSVGMKDVVYKTVPG